MRITGRGGLCLQVRWWVEVGLLGGHAGESEPDSHTPSGAMGVSQGRVPASSDSSPLAPRFRAFLPFGCESRVGGGQAQPPALSPPVREFGGQGQAGDWDSNIWSNPNSDHKVLLCDTRLVPLWSEFPLLESRVLSELTQVCPTLSAPS